MSVKKGCTGCILLPVFCIVALLFIIFATTGNFDSTPAPITTTAPIEFEQEFPFEFIARKVEPDTGHTMDLYAYSGPLRAAEVVAFLKDRKARSPSESFYMVVIFDKKSNAKFPDNPFTADYGVDFEILKHIRVYYVFNKLNGYSELRGIDGRGRPTEI